MTYLIQPLSLRTKLAVACQRPGQEAAPPITPFPVTVFVSKPRNRPRQLAESRAVENDLRGVFKASPGLSEATRIKTVNGRLRALLNKLNSAN